MKNYKMMALFLMLILCIAFVFGMDNYSEKPESSNEEDPKDLKKYTKHEPNLHTLNSDIEINTYNEEILINNYASQNYDTEDKADIKNSVKVSEQNFNEYNKSKRKRKFCEYCGLKSTDGRLSDSQFTNNALCYRCYSYERKNKRLIPLSERKKRTDACCKHSHILACEFCKRESISYQTGKVSGKSLCKACYSYEYRYGHSVPLDERKIIQKHSNILVCEGCQQESTQFLTGKVSGKSLCRSCYVYEKKHRYLVTLDERDIRYPRYPTKRQSYGHIFACEFCQQESTKFITGKFSSKVLCKICYNYEALHGYLLPRDERKKGRKINLHKNTKKNTSNCLITAENSQNENKHKIKEKIGNITHSTEQQKARDENIFIFLVLY